MTTLVACLRAGVWTVGDVLFYMESCFTWNREQPFTFVVRWCAQTAGLRMSGLLTGGPMAT
jgi:hypothetical protein